MAKLVCYDKDFQDGRTFIDVKYLEYLGADRVMDYMMKAVMIGLDEEFKEETHLGLRSNIAKYEAQICKHKMFTCSCEDIYGRVFRKANNHCGIKVYEWHIDRDDNVFPGYTFHPSTGVQGSKWGPLRYSDLFYEENYKKIRSYRMRPHPKKVMTNTKNDTDYTTVVWSDGSHTVVKRAKDDTNDPEKAILYAIIKKMCNDSSCEVDRYLKKFLKEVSNG